MARTLDQATRVVEFVDRYSATYDSLKKISGEKRNYAESLLLEAMQAVREDLAAERAMLPEFEKNISSVRSALLLYFPNRNITWIPYLLFYTMLIFIVYIIIVRLVKGGWTAEDMVAILIAGVCASLVRLVVRLTDARE